ncbi:MAG: hypothetical protein QM479_09745, partial [Pseudomonadota bacterium]
MNKSDNNFPSNASGEPFSKESYAQDKDTADAFSQDKFDEMDELALSLQQQIRDLDNIPDLDSQLDQESGAQENNDLEHDIADDVYDNSYSQNNEPDIDAFKQQIQAKLAENESHGNFQGPIFFRLQFLIPAIIGLFFIVGSATYFLLNDTPQPTYSTDLYLPEKSISMLSDEPELVTVDIENVPAKNNSKTVITSENPNAADNESVRPLIENKIIKPLRKIPLVYIDELDEQLETKRQLPKTKVSEEINLTQSEAKQTVQPKFEHNLKQQEVSPVKTTA